MEGKHYPIPRIFCGAKTRSGGSCRQPAMKNGRCRLHGGKSKSGKEHGRYVHGKRTQEAIKIRKDIYQIIRESKALMAEIDRLNSL